MKRFHWSIIFTDIKFSSKTPPIAPRIKAFKRLHVVQILSSITSLLLVTCMKTDRISLHSILSVTFENHFPQPGTNEINFKTYAWQVGFDRYPFSSPLTLLRRFFVWWLAHSQYISSGLVQRCPQSRRKGNLFLVEYLISFWERGVS